VAAAKVALAAPSLLSTPSERGQQYIFVVERQIVLELTSPADLVGALLGTFFVFNIQYPLNTKQFYLALESMMLEKTSEKMPTSLKVIMNSLKRVYVLETLRRCLFSQQGVNMNRLSSLMCACAGDGIQGSQEKNTRNWCSPYTPRQSL
jgi:hypothetical protein